LLDARTGEETMSEEVKNIITIDEKEERA